MKKNRKLTNELISPLSDFMDLFLMGGGGGVAFNCFQQCSFDGLILP